MSSTEHETDRRNIFLRTGIRLSNSAKATFSPQSIGVGGVQGAVRSSPLALCISAINSAMSVLGLWGTVEEGPLLVWLATTWMLCGYFLIKWLNTRQRVITKVSTSAVVKVTIFTIFLALPWAWLTVAYVGAVPVQQEALLYGIVAGMSAGGAIIMARVPQAALAFLAVVLGSFIAKCLALEGHAYKIISVFALVYGAFLCAVVLNYARLARPVVMSKAANWATLSRALFRAAICCVMVRRLASRSNNNRA